MGGTAAKVTSASVVCPCGDWYTYVGLRFRFVRSRFLSSCEGVGSEDTLCCVTVVELVLMM